MDSETTAGNDQTKLSLVFPNFQCLRQWLASPRSRSMINLIQDMQKQEILYPGPGCDQLSCNGKRMDTS